MLAIEPAGDYGGDEELGTVAVMVVSVCWIWVCGDDVAHVLGPALAIDKSPGLVCFLAKFSSANFSP